MPLRPFMQSLPYPFPAAAFDNGLASMPWFELMDELGEIVCADEWLHAKDVAYLQNALYEQIGATAFLTEAASDELQPEKPRPKSGKSGGDKTRIKESDH